MEATNTEIKLNPRGTMDLIHLCPWELRIQIMIEVMKSIWMNYNGTLGALEQVADFEQLCTLKGER